MPANPWIWHEGHNPYRSTAFQVLALGVDVRGRAAIRAQIRLRRQRIQSAPERFPLFGRTLSEAEINEAEEQIQDPAARLMAELCTHRPRPAHIDLGDLGDRLAAIAAHHHGDTPATVSPNWQELRRLVAPPQRRLFDPLWADDDDATA